MNVLFISDPVYIESEIYNAEGYANRPMLQAMPCELEIATTAQQAKTMIPDVDIVLLESLRGVSFRDQLNFINNYDVLVGAFYCDVWRGPFWDQSLINIDVNISVYKAVALVTHSTWNDRNFFWCPPRVNPLYTDIKRDMDLVSWGSSGREYPFRNFAYQALMCSLVGGPRRLHNSTKIEPCLSLNKVSICGHDYRWLSVAGKRMHGPVYGQKLWDTLSRCKLCATGPVVQRTIGSVVARYFENAACGVISITPEMEDAGELGFIHGENIWYSKPDKFFHDIQYLLETPSVLDEMSNQAIKLINDKHSIQARANQLYDFLSERIKGK